MIFEYLQVMSNMLCGVNFIAGYEALMVAKKVPSHNTLPDDLNCSENIFFLEIKKIAQERIGNEIHAAHGQATYADCAHRLV